MKDRTPTDAAIRFDVPHFPVAASLTDPRRGAAEAAARRRDAGYAEGYEAGLQRADAEVAQAIEDHRRSAGRLGELSEALERACADLAVRDQVAIADIEADVVALAVALAGELVGRELRTVDGPVLDALARVAGLVPDRGAPVVRVHPDEAATAREAVGADVVRWSDRAVVTPDPLVERGGCVVEVGACSIDGQVGSALARMRDVLLAPAGDAEAPVPSAVIGADDGGRAGVTDLLARPVDSAQSSP